MIESMQEVDKDKATSGLGKKLQSLEQAKQRLTNKKEKLREKKLKAGREQIEN